MKKKLIICLLALIIAALATIELSITNFARDAITYNVEISDESQIDEILINENETTIQFENLDNVNIEASVIDDIKIEYNGDIIVTDNTGKIVEDKTGVDDNLFLHSVSKKDVILGSLNTKSLVYFVICFILSVLSLVYISYFVNKYNGTKDSFKIRDFLILSISVFVIFMLTFYFLLYILDVAVVILPLAVVFYLVHKLKDNIKERIENLYIILAIAFGVTMIFVLPPFNAPDEYAHFVKSYTFTTFADDKGVTNLPVSLESLYSKYGHSLLDQKMDFETKSYFNDLMQDNNKDVLSENEFVYTNTKYLKVLPYLPSAILLFLLKLIGVSPLVMSVAGRFLSLIVMLIMYYLAIKNVPILKRLFMVICLLPIVLHQAVINQDYLTNATVILLIAMVLKYRYKQIRIGIEEMSILSVLGIMIACCKFGYFVFLGVIFLIPCRLFKTKKVAVLFKLAFIIIPIMVSFIGNVAITAAEDTTHYSISYSLSNPVNTIKVFAKTFWQRAELDLFRGQFDGFGVSTKWNNGFISSVLYFIYILYFLSSEKQDVEKIEKKTRIVLFVIAFLLIGVVYSAMYLNWTNIGADTIDGLQPRYFTPAILCLALAFSNSIIKIDVNNKEKLDTILMCVIYVCVFSTIILGFYA
jgi:uncharacterized membrane protein